jgi:hypothetical protein
MSASNFLELELLDHVLGNAAYTAPATLYVALHTADPGEAGAQNTNEATGTSYARVAVTNNATNFPAASGGSKSNGTAINFPTPGSGGWGTVTHWSIGDAASGAGNILFSGALTLSKTINAGDTVSFAAGALTVTAD